MEVTGFSEITMARLLYQGEDPWYIEIALTGRCNFNCTYCNRFHAESSYGNVKKFFDSFDTCKHVQLTGGEPTLHKDLASFCRLVKSKNAKIGLSTNGSMGIDKYLNLDVDMFSISLDDYDLSILESRGYRNPAKVIETIRELSRSKYVNIGLVIDSLNVDRIENIIEFILELGVNDIKLSSSTKDELPVSFTRNYDKYPILRYRTKNFNNGLKMRGNPPEKCHIVKNDVTIVGDKHYPCLVYFREGGKAIGMVSERIMNDRRLWFETHNSQSDIICAKYCMDFKCEFNRNIEGFL